MTDQKWQIAFGCHTEPEFREATYFRSETPDAEVTNGIQQIYISSYGDDVNGVFISVTAETLERAGEVYRRVHREVIAPAAKWYSKTTEEVPSGAQGA